MPHYLFLTGKLAEPSLRRMLAELAPRVGFEYRVAVLPITVAALATTPWIARHYAPTTPLDRIVLPGLCNGDLAALTDAWGNFLIERGPDDLRDLPEYFGAKGKPNVDYGKYDIEIICEINHAPRLTPAAILTKATWRRRGTARARGSCFEPWSHARSSNSFRRRPTERSCE